MKKMRTFLCSGLALALLLTGCADKTNSASVLEEASKNYVASVDVDYSYDLALRMEENKSNEQLGYRTAGSEAEFLTGEMLVDEMKRIGLTNVSKDEFTLDGWTFEKAELTYTQLDGNEKTIQLGGYQTNFDTAGLKEYTVIDGGNGTETDLKELDVTDKLVLIDINQRDNWWINYPAYEAHLHGAAAVIAAQNGGYGEISDDALNAQDICGPDDAPAFSISKNDADILRDIMAAKQTNEIKVRLDAKSVVERNVKSYNIVGVIPGKTDDMVLMSAHYDSYFAGFQDDNAAIALMMGIAKGIIDSGYEPQKTLVFCAMAAEEWGTVNTRYDWSTGAYNQIFRVHPEWVGKVMADINFELPAMNEGTTDQIRSSYELATYLNAFKESVPKIEGVFEEGIEIIVPTQTWSDDFSLSIAGIPATVTALREGFAASTYHSQFDNKDTYSREAFLYHHNLYGMLMVAYDQLAVSPLDFTTRLNALKNVSEEGILTKSQSADLNQKIETVLGQAAQAWQTVQKANDEYTAALNSGDQTKANEILQKYAGLNEMVLETFKFAEDHFVRLTWEDVSFFPHEHSANNIAALKGAIAALEDGKASTALDEYLYLVDNNWYAYDWSKETYHYFTDYVLHQSADRLMWGAGRVQGHTDLFEVIRSLMAKEDQADYTDELAILNEALSKEEGMLQSQIDFELESLDELQKYLKDIGEYQ